MAKKRSKGQGIDKIIGDLRRISRNEEKFSASQLVLMLESCKLQMALDGILPEQRLTQVDSGQPSPTDAMLDSLRAKHTGGDNANS